MCFSSASSENLHPIRHVHMVLVSQVSAHVLASTEKRCLEQAWFACQVVYPAPQKPHGLTLEPKSLLCYVARTWLTYRARKAGQADEQSHFHWEDFAIQSKDKSQARVKWADCDELWEPQSDRMTTWRMHLGIVSVVQTSPSHQMILINPQSF